MTGYIYAVQSGYAVKIGYSHKPALRAMNLRTGNPVRADLLGFVAAEPEQERELHKLLAGARIGREWFRCADPLVRHFLSILPRVPPAPRGRNDGSIKSLLQERKIKLSHLARDLGVDKGTLTKWCQGQIPAKRVLDVEKRTGIPRHDLRSDIYPEDVPHTINHRESGDHAD